MLYRETQLGEDAGEQQVLFEAIPATSAGHKLGLQTGQVQEDGPSQQYIQVFKLERLYKILGPRRVSKKLAQLEKTLYCCMPDAQAAMAGVQKESPHYHDLELKIEERPLYARGRPKADGSHTVKQMRYALTGRLVPKPEAIDTMREQAGCFVLITDVSLEGPPRQRHPL